MIINKTERYDISLDRDEAYALGVVLETHSAASLKKHGLTQKESDAMHALFALLPGLRKEEE